MEEQKEQNNWFQNNPIKTICLKVVGYPIVAMIFVILVSVVVIKSYSNQNNVMGILLWIIVIGTSIWVYFDAKSIGVKRGQVRGLADADPVVWLFGTLLLWIFFFPFYLVKRSEFKRINNKLINEKTEISNTVFTSSMCFNCGDKSIKEHHKLCGKCGISLISNNVDAIKKCQYCQKEIDVNAVKCPYCQSKLKSSGLIGYIILLIFIALFFWWIFAPSGINKKDYLQSCLTVAQNTYRQNWDKECIAEGRSSGLNCKIYTEQANFLDNRLQNDKDDCYHLYPQ